MTKQKRTSYRVLSLVSLSLLIAAATYGLSLSDAAAALMAVAGLTAGIVIARRRVSRLRCLQQFVPIVTSCVQKAV